MKKKAAPQIEIPLAIAIHLDKIDTMANDENLPEDVLIQLQDLSYNLTHAIRNLASDLDSAKTEVVDLEDKITDLEEAIENHPAKATLAQFEDPGNWQDGNRWVPVLKSTTNDPLLFIEGGF